MRRLLILVAVLALLAVPAVPAAAADEVVTGTFTLATIDVTAPNIPDFGLFVSGDNFVNSGADGDVTVTNYSQSPSGWTVTAKDLAASNPGYMKRTTGPEKWLTSKLDISNGGAYFTADIGTTWTGAATGTDVLPTWLRQNVVDGDEAGLYSITITYTGALTF